MKNEKNMKLKELTDGGYENTGRFHTILNGVNKDKKFPIYAAKSDIAAMIYNYMEDRIALVYEMPVPYDGKRHVERKDIIRGN